MHFCIAVIQDFNKQHSDSYCVFFDEAQLPQVTAFITFRSNDLSGETETLCGIHRPTVVTCNSDYGSIAVLLFDSLL